MAKGADGFDVKADAHGFDTAEAAEAYERARPSYPAEAVAYIVGRGGIGPRCRVLDLAAGTGKLTRLLEPTGAHIMAVEPMAQMREQLSRALPNVEVYEGAAEAMPVPSGTIQTVTVGHAFHWFDAPAALAEIRRVMVMNGHLFLVWNMRDRSHAWVREYGELLVDGDRERPYDSYYGQDYAGVVADAAPRRFTHEDTWSHWWEEPYDEALLLARTASTSVVGVMSEDERAVVLDRVRTLVHTHPDLAGRTSFGFPYVTKIWHFRVAR